MTQYKRIGIGTSKAVFTLHGIDPAERPTLRLNLRRTQMISFFNRLRPPRLPWKPVAAHIIGPGN